MGNRRKLTAGEIALARAAFGDRIDYSRVKLSDGPGTHPMAHMAFAKGNPAITIGNTVYFKTGFCPDFSARGEDGRSFMHEMTHVWQYRSLGMPAFFGRYGAELLQAGGKPNDMYKYKVDSKFNESMLEAQAQMIGDYHRAKSSRDREGAAKLEANLKGSGLHGL